jgi:hypothetical protein
MTMRKPPTTICSLLLITGLPGMAHAGVAPSSTLGQRVMQPAQPVQPAPAPAPQTSAPRATVPAATAVTPQPTPTAVTVPAATAVTAQPAGAAITPQHAPTAVPPSAASSAVQPALKAASPAAAQHSSAQRITTQGKTSGVVASTRQSKYLPDRTETTQSQAMLRDSENAIAQNARKAAPTAHPAALTAPARAADPPGVRMAAMPASAALAPAGRSKADTPAGIFNSPPGIWFVNNKDKNFVLTPGGYVTILGKGFGAGMGEVNMFGHTNPGKLALQVIDWNDGEIYAVLPPGVRGYADQAARLQVVTRVAGQVYGLDTGRFYATREEITLGTSLSRAIDLHPSVTWAATIADDGRVDRVEDGSGGNDIDCKSPGTDVLYFRPLPNGFVLTGISYWFGRTDSGDGDMDGKEGDRVFTPGYSVGDWGTSKVGSVAYTTLPVSFGVFRSHHAKALYNNFGSPDHCESTYQVELSVSGPAGVKPY